MTVEEAREVLQRSKNCLPGSEVLETWTSSTVAGRDDLKYLYYLNQGELTSFDGAPNYGIRLVRGDQSSSVTSTSSSNIQRPNSAQSTRQATTENQPPQSQNQQSQQAQQAAQQSQQLAQQNQTRADQQRQGKRKTHDPAAEAHECISIDKAGSGNFGAFKNQCPYPVNFTTCNEKPRVIQGGFNWSADFDCAKQQFGLHTPKGNSSVAAHNRSTEFVYWFACKAPATPADATYTPGKGIEARCHN